jgi:hypothetical protein
VLILSRRFPLAEKPIGSVRKNGDLWYVECKWLGEDEATGRNRYEAAERLIDIYLEKGP